MRRLDENRRSIGATLLHNKLKNQIIGQDEAVEALVDTIEKWNAGFYDRSRPIASMLFMGPTGVGKTEIGEILAESLFGSRDYLLRVDCAEFQHSHDVARLQGSPPGYLGHNETHPFFTNDRLAARRTEKYPFTVIQFDEIEKANDALWNLLLGILDKGTMTTGTNHVVDFSQCIILMTSNIGARESSDKGHGFTKDDVLPFDRMKEVSLATARKKFLPEFMNRLDKIIVFQTLTKEQVEQIATVQLNRLNDRIQEQSKIRFTFEVTTSGWLELMTEGYNPRDNARFLKRTIEKRIAEPMSAIVATKQIFDNDVITVDYAGGWKYFATKGTIKSGLQQGQVEVPPLLK